MPWPLLPQMTVSSRPGVRLAEADLDGLAVQLYGVARAALLAAHGADFAVDLHGPALHELLGFAAGLTQARIFQQGVQLDEFGMDEDLLHFITPLSRF